MSGSRETTELLETTVDLLRHGEPEGGRRYRGQIDDPLSPLGWRQMRDALGDTAPWQQIVSSPLQRCSAFAGAVADKHGISLSLESAFKEIGFGSWEGRTPEAIQQSDPEAYRRYRADPLSFMPEGAEPMSAFMARVAAAWQAMLATYRGRHVLVVCHAGVIRAVLAAVLEMAPDKLFRIQIGYAARLRFQSVNGETPRLIFLDGGVP